MTSFGGNPFSALTIVVAPAILTNASSVLCLGTANRLARVVDRTRMASRELALLTPNTDEFTWQRQQLEALRVRWTLVLRALILFYVSLGSFGAASLISLCGSGVATSGQFAFRFIALLALSSGTVGVGGLVVGCTIMARETRLAIQNLAEEAQRW